MDLFKEAEMNEKLNRLDAIFQKELNLSQKQAANYGKGSALLIAGAGSGKTKTLTYRTARLLASGVSPSNIVLLTFTNKAAHEMLNRMANVLKRLGISDADVISKQIRGGTFHSFCTSICRQFASVINYQSNFKIIDPADSESLFKLLMEQYPEEGLKFPRPSALASAWSYFRNIAGSQCTTSFQDVLCERLISHEPLFSHLTKICLNYQDVKERDNLMDYDDLIHNTLAIFEKSPDAQKRVSGACQFIMVDEYQDTNDPQVDLLKAISFVHKNVVAVGDDAQSLYSFRGANHKNILNFPNDFKGADGLCPIIKLEENYRSNQHILDVSNVITGMMKEQFNKKLYTTTKLTGEKPVYKQVRDSAEQARQIVDQIKELKSKGIPYSQQCAIIRFGRNSAELETTLAANGIKFVKYGGMKFIQMAHIKDCTSFLSLCENPKDAISFRRVATMVAKVGDKVADNIHKQWLMGNTQSIKGKSFEFEIGMLFNILEECQSFAPSFALKKFIEWYKPKMALRYKEDFKTRANDLAPLVEICANYKSTGKFLNEIVLDMERFIEKPDDYHEDKFVISTVHSVKGLEFSAVYVLGVCNGVFPTQTSMHDPVAMEEEKRIFYVALTRAKDHLYIYQPLYMFTFDQGVTPDQSIFMREIIKRKPQSIHIF